MHDFGSTSFFDFVEKQRNFYLTTHFVKSDIRSKKREVTMKTLTKKIFCCLKTQKKLL